MIPFSSIFHSRLFGEDHEQKKKSLSSLNIHNVGFFSTCHCKCGFVPTDMVCSLSSHFFQKQKEAVHNQVFSTEPCVIFTDYKNGTAVILCW